MRFGFPLRIVRESKAALPAILLTLSASLIKGGEVEPTIRFFADGSLVSLKLDGQEAINPDAPSPGGFFVLLFKGVRVEEIRLTQVSRRGERLVVKGAADFPQFEFLIQETPGEIKLRLAKMVGVPLGRDSSLLFRIPTNLPLDAKPLPTDAAPASSLDPGMQIEASREAVAIYWTYLGARSSRKSLEGFSLRVLSTSHQPQP